MGVLFLISGAFPSQREREREGGKTDYVLFHAFVRLVEHVFDCVTGLQGFALEV